MIQEYKRNKNVNFQLYTCIFCATRNNKQLFHLRDTKTINYYHHVPNNYLFYLTVRVGLAWWGASSQGPLEYYDNGTWVNICDDGNQSKESRDLAARSV